MTSILSKTLTAAQVVDALELESHVEGGFFKRTFQADDRQRVKIEESAERYLMTSIFYMLTDEAPVGRWHLNKSDIVHYFHLGDAVEYSLIFPDGRLESHRMGADILNGEKLQLVVKGGVWKTSRLISVNTGYGLISEAVAPGFDFSDMTLGDPAQLKALFPQHEREIDAYCA